MFKKAVEFGRKRGGGKLERLGIGPFPVIQGLQAFKDPYGWSIKPKGAGGGTGGPGKGWELFSEKSGL